MPALRISSARCPSATSHGFTLVELLLSITIFSVVLMITASMLDSTIGQLRVADARFNQFQESQAAFESMNLRLAGCELNPYYDYGYPADNKSTLPTSYKLSSDLHFVCGPSTGGSTPLLTGDNRFTHSVFFHGTYGLTDEQNWGRLDNLLNSWGYFIEFGSDASDRANFLNSSTVQPRYRFRLKELQVPSESLRTYALKLSDTSQPITKLYDWFRTPANNPTHVRTIAENIIALVITPLRPAAGGLLSNDLAPDYFYDSRAFQHSPGSGLAERTRHKLPPLLRITLVALDETSAQRLQEEYGESVPDLGIENLFKSKALERYQADLDELETTLQSKKLRYRIFTNTVRMRNARWTSDY